MTDFSRVPFEETETESDEDEDEDEDQAGQQAALESAVVLYVNTCSEAVRFCD